MSGDGLDQIERLALSCLRTVAASERRQLLRSIARDVRQAQGDRIAAQREPDGGAFAPRRPKREEQAGAYPLKFLYPKGAAEPRLVSMRSWVRQGPLLTGFDAEAGGIRSFFWDKVAQWLPADGAARPAGSRLRRRGSVRAKAMFRKLRTGRYPKSNASADEAWVGWIGGAATIARIHQDGASDRPTPRAKPVRYARRVLLGLTTEERGLLVDRLFSHLATTDWR